MIVGISGKIGCGKTTLADLLVEAMGPEWRRMSLGDEVKKEASEKFDFPLWMAYSQAGKKALVQVPGTSDQMSVREILQYWGTDVRRAEDQNYWVKKLSENIPSWVKHVVVDDIRFLTEVDFIRSNGGMLFRLNQYPGYEPPAIGGDHASETELDDYQGWDASFAPPLGTLGRVADTIAKVLRQEAGV